MRPEHCSCSYQYQPLHPNWQAAFQHPPYPLRHTALPHERIAVTYWSSLVLKYTTAACGHSLLQLLIPGWCNHSARSSPRASSNLPESSANCTQRCPLGFRASQESAPQARDDGGGAGEVLPTEVSLTAHVIVVAEPLAHDLLPCACALGLHSANMRDFRWMCRHCARAY
jgi:hypothetical protein